MSSGRRSQSCSLRWLAIVASHEIPSRMPAIFATLSAPRAGSASSEARNAMTQKPIVTSCRTRITNAIPSTAPSASSGSIPASRPSNAAAAARPAATRGTGESSRSVTAGRYVRAVSRCFSASSVEAV